MKAIVVTPGAKDSIRLEDVEKPIANKTQSLLGVLQIGIDGTDLDINEGQYGEAPAGSNYLIAGHECLATLEEISGESNGLVKGDLVVPTVRRPDDCFNCANGESDMCVAGNYKEHGIKGLHGFASEYAISDTRFLIRIPKELERIGVLLEPLSVAEKAVFQAYKIQERMRWEPKRALILGAGPLGLLTSCLLRLQGLEVYSVATRARDSTKARLVERVGGVYVNSKEQPIGSLGSFDLIMEETGVPSVAMQAQQMLGRNGVMCFLGIYPHKEASEDIGHLYTDIVLGNKIFFGSVNANKRYFEMGVKHFVEIEKRFPSVLHDMITNVIAPTDYMKGYKPDEENIKTVIDFRNES